MSFGFHFDWPVIVCEWIRFVWHLIQLCATITVLSDWFDGEHWVRALYFHLHTHFVDYGSNIYIRAAVYMQLYIDYVMFLWHTEPHTHAHHRRHNHQRINKPNGRPNEWNEPNTMYEKRIRTKKRRSHKSRPNERIASHRPIQTNHDTWILNILIFMLAVVRVVVVRVVVDAPRTVSLVTRVK